MSVIIDMMRDSEGRYVMDREDWDHFRNQAAEKKTRELESEKQLLNSLTDVKVMAVEDDGSGGERYKLLVATDRGHREVLWWTRTGLWKVSRGKGEGYGLYRMTRYFNLAKVG